MRLVCSCLLKLHTSCGLPVRCSLVCIASFLPSLFSPLFLSACLAAFLHSQALCKLAALSTFNKLHLPVTLQQANLIQPADAAASGFYAANPNSKFLHFYNTSSSVCTSSCTATMHSIAASQARPTTIHHCVPAKQQLKSVHGHSFPVMKHLPLCYLHAARSSHFPLSHSLTLTHVHTHYLFLSLRLPVSQMCGSTTGRLAALLAFPSPLCLHPLG